MEQTQARELFICLLRMALQEMPVTPQLKEQCSEQLLIQVYDLAHRHDLAHMIGQVVCSMDLPKYPILVNFQKDAFMAAYRYNQIQHEYTKICDALEKVQVPFIPLKGSVLRQYYPEPWMRTSCDIDILVDPKDLEKASAYLQEQLQYNYRKKGSHDICLRSGNGVYLELHYKTIEAWEKAKNVLEDIWDGAEPVEPGRYQYRLSNEMFWLYHIIHMGKHAANGGCGVRSFMDLWLMKRNMPVDRQKLETLLDQSGWLAFGRAAEKLMQTWFEEEPADPMTQHFSAFILEGRVYGSLQNAVIIDQQKRGGKLGYVWGKVFLPYNTLRVHYPILKKHKWLTPVYEVVRWWKILFCGGVESAVNDLRINAAITDEEREQTSQLLDYLGIDLHDKIMG